MVSDSAFLDEKKTVCIIVTPLIFATSAIAFVISAE